MHTPDIARLRRRIGAWLTLKHSLAWLTLGAFVWGTVVVAGRVSLHETPAWMTWGLLLLPILAGCGIVQAIRQVPTPAAVRAFLDRASGCGGLLMTSAEEPLGAWKSRVPAVADVAVRWRGGHSGLLFLAAIVFLGASFAFPQRLATWGEEPLQIGNDVKQLLKKIEVLREEKLLEKERTDVLAEQVRQVQEKAEGRSPTKTLEALDRLRDKIEQAARKAAEAALDKHEKLDAAEHLAEQIRKHGDKLDDTVKAEALAELNDLVNKAKLESDLLDQNVDPELLKKLAQGKLSDEDLKRLADALKNADQRVRKSLEKLAKERLFDPDEIAKRMAEDPGEGDTEGEESIEDPMSLDELRRGIRRRGKEGREGNDFTRGNGGRGGGRSSPPITWTDGSSEEGAKYKEQVLPPSDLKQLKDSQIIGVHRADPKADAKSSQSGALRGANAGGGAANAAIVLPQHRGAVERFFDRTQKKE